MFVKPSRAFVEKPSLVASSSGSAKKARYARLLPSTRNSSESRTGPSSSCSSAPVSVLGTGQRYRPRAMPELQIQPFSDEHLDAAAELLAQRHRRHRQAEPLLPELSDPLAQIESEWRSEDASGAFASRAGKPVGYVVAAPVSMHGPVWMRVGIAGHAVEGDTETVRDLYASAAQRWVDDGHTRHAAFVPSFDTELVDAWFRLSFGASAALAMRETGPEEIFDGGVTIRPGTRDDFSEGARLELAMSEAMLPSPSFSDVPLQSHEEVLAEWMTDGSGAYEFFVAERDERIVGHIVLYRRPPDLRVPAEAI